MRSIFFAGIVLCCILVCMMDSAFSVYMTENPFIGVDVGDVVAFGQYEQDGDETNGQEAIKWRVLAIEDEKALVISEYALDAKQYNEEPDGITWEKCTLRSWLNKDFLNNAFTEDEQEMISLTEIINEDNPKYGTKGGNNTEDKIFLLSIEEVEKYFADDESRIVDNTQYAKNNVYATDSFGRSWWWLRSPGCSRFEAAGVYSSGGVSMGGIRVIYADGVVRPALFIDLDV